MVLGGYEEVPLKTTLRANTAMRGTETGCVLVAFSQSICTEGQNEGSDNKSHLPGNTLKIVFPVKLPLKSAREIGSSNETVPKQNLSKAVQYVYFKPFF